uniref:G protein-coupled receptor 148 n=1 Tax=Microcebus murinus TaxID=30608 RepID=A0A8C5XK06_MICMU
MEGKLAPCFLGTTAWSAPAQLASNIPCMPQVASNTSLDLRELRVPSSVLHSLCLPSSLLAMATLSQQLQQDPHYLLLANILLSDLACLLLHTLISYSSLSDAVFTTQTSTILSLTATVLHTHLAVAHPLRYLSFVSCGEVWKAVALIWLVAFFLSHVSPLVQQVAGCPAGGAWDLVHLADEPEHAGLCPPPHHHPHFHLVPSLPLHGSHCLLLPEIYAEARTSDICTKGYSLARGTLLMHSVLITLCMSTGVMFSLDVMLTKYHHIGARTHKWLLVANSEVLMMLPRAMLPYLYLLRYRQLALFSSRRHKAIFTTS